MSLGISKNNIENKNNEEVLDCFIEKTILFHNPTGLCSITYESILIMQASVLKIGNNGDFQTFSSHPVTDHLAIKLQEYRPTNAPQSTNDK
jgi:hypothetical protein